MPGLVTGSFAGVLTPAQVHEVLNALITGAPFAGSLTRANTSTGKLAFPTVAPSGYAWLAELEEVPRLVLDDKALIVAVKKVMGGLPISSEMRADATVNITNWVRDGLTDSLSRDLDQGLLLGGGAKEPEGVIAQAEAVAGETLIAAAGAAIAEIGEKGGSCNTICLSPTAYADELVSKDDNGRLMHPDGLPDLLGLTIVQSPGLADPLVYDAKRCYLVLGHDSNVTLHDDPQHDAILVNVSARVNAGIPVAGKSIRKLDVTGGSARAAGGHRSGKAA